MILAALSAAVFVALVPVLLRARPEPQRVAVREKHENRRP